MRFHHLLFSLLLLLSCSSQKNTAENVVRTTAPENRPDCLELTLSETEKYPDANITTVLEYRLEEGCIYIKYNYSGCHEGEPLLIWNGITNSEGTRPKVNMDLLVQEAGQCEQLLEGEAYFSMATMRSVGSQVLVFLNNIEQQNYLLNFQNPD